MQPIEVFIFCYNRGRFLLNCVESAKKFIPKSKITVIDDHSNNKETLDALNAISKDVTVLQTQKTENMRWGGFYRNINWVIQELAQSPWVVLIEDDMQFIRPFLDEDYKRINRFFKNHPETGCMTLEFLKEEHREKDKNTIIVDKQENMYFFTDDAISYRGTIHICSSGVLNIKRMREVGYHFLGSRPEVRKRGKQFFTKKGVYPYPLLMYLPFPPTIKNRSTTITRRLVEKWFRTGFYPYQEMTEEKLNNFLNRDISILPYASDFLKTALPSPGPPYEYKDSMKRVNKLVKKIEFVEKRVRNIFSIG